MMNDISARARLLPALAAFVLGLLVWLPAQAQQVGSASGLPLPRFVSLRDAPSNVRVGPGTQYAIAWSFVVGGVPLEIIQEFDTWRKVRDVDGDEGWLHQSLLVGNRTALVTPWANDGETALRAGASANSAVRAWLSPDIIVGVRKCDGAFCEIDFAHTDAEGRSQRYRGFVAQDSLWGVYQGEVFD